MRTVGIAWWILAVVSVALPVAGFVTVRRKTGVSLKPAWHGVAVYGLFGVLAGSTVIAWAQNTTAWLTVTMEHPVWAAVACGVWQGLTLTAGCLIWQKWVLRGDEAVSGAVLGMGVGTVCMALAGCVSGVVNGLNCLPVADGQTHEVLAELTAVSASYSVSVVFLQILRVAAVFVMMVALCLALFALVRRQGKPVFAVGAILCYLASCVMENMSVWTETRIIPVQTLLAAGMVLLICATGVIKIQKKVRT